MYQNVVNAICIKLNGYIYAQVQRATRTAYFEACLGVKSLAAGWLVLAVTDIWFSLSSLAGLLPGNDRRLAPRCTSAAAKGLPDMSWRSSVLQQNQVD